MNTSFNRYLKPTLGALLLCILVSAVATIARSNLHVTAQKFKAKEETPLTTSVRLEVENKARYFLGETPTITISTKNTNRSPQTVKEAEYQKFSLEMTGLFEDASEQQKKTIVYDGSWDIPKRATTPPLRGETHVFEALRKREPKFVKLAPGESTTLVLDLSKTFSSYLGVGKYRMVVKSEDGQKAVKEFEVYFDDEKSVAVLAEFLKADNESERFWAVSNLAQFSRPKLVTLLEELVKAGNEQQRDFASGMLARTKAGWFDSLKLRVENKDRYFLGETPIVAISIKNASSTPKTLKEAEGQKFFLELRRVFGNDSQPETKTCVYDGNERQGKPKLVTLAELDSTTLSLNLTKCFGTSFDIGKYELIVRAADEEGFKDQTVVKKFEVYFDDQESVRALGQLLKSDDLSERNSAVSKLAQFSRTKLIALLEELVKSGNEKQREVARGILAEIKAGHFAPAPGSANTKPGGE